MAEGLAGSCSASLEFAAHLFGDVPHLNRAHVSTIVHAQCMQKLVARKLRSMRVTRRMRGARAKVLSVVATQAWVPLHIVLEPRQLDCIFRCPLSGVGPDGSTLVPSSFFVWLILRANSRNEAWILALCGVVSACESRNETICCASRATGCRTCGRGEF